MPGQLFIDTPRLELRTAEPEDKEFLRTGLNHPDIRRYIDTFRTPTTADEYDDLYEEYDGNPDTVSLLLVPKEGNLEGEPVGSAQLAPINDARGWANLGAWLHPNAWGEGYATEACAYLIDYGFSDLRLHRISASIDSANEASIALCERLGFTHEGVSRDDVFADGEYRDRERYGLLEGEWEGPAAVIE